MAVSLKWKGDELYLGKTMMAHVRKEKGASGGWAEGAGWEYVLGPDDFVSPPYERKQDTMNDCFDRVRDMLARAGA